ncbi:hypothetical protein ARC78_07500 [Stenotrophomonas pictorum JCM 9942]|uniref:Uncharacterized protein n=1 Tax=Stenotrophomonas pictorum JCM 9942 TaxID=1236960 RepID=A0A0R0ASS2_9GAMM|nr:hypothetical protein [Stenotrophomonas pictorum]KRG43203.1 hypothetical protein ARC78_07500 [Stenotrophomonas pictorum JCM 9942]
MHSLILLALSLTAQPDAVALKRIDYLRCLSNMERVSTARLMSQPAKSDEIAAAMLCVDAYRQLDHHKASELKRVYEAFTVQLEAPSAVAHGELISASTIFMRGL